MRVASKDANERVRFFYIVEEGVPAVTFETIQNITDWQFYFDNQKAGLDKLKEEWNKINF